MTKAPCGSTLKNRTWNHSNAHEREKENISEVNGIQQLIHSKEEEEVLKKIPQNSLTLEAKRMVKSLGAMKNNRKN